MSGIDYQRVIDWLDDWIVLRTRQVVVTFLVVTAVFAVGLGNVSTEAGTEQFSEEIPEQEALEAVDEEFEPQFGPDVGTTQLIQSDENVLSREGMVRMLLLLERIEERPDLRVANETSAAGIVARTLDPEATTPERQREVIEGSTPGEIRAAVRNASGTNPEFATLLSDDYNPEEGYASATVTVVEHSVPTRIDDTGGESADDPLTPIQLRIRDLAGTVGGDIRVFGSGIVSEEFSNVIGDTLLIVVPAAVVLILFFLVLAYRDLVDLLLGVVALVMAIVWTFGFMGLVGIAFNQILIAVPPLLLAVGIDYGIHSVNRYREEREEGNPINPAMRRTTDQLLVAFFIVTTTSVVGFASNLTSGLLPIRDFGVVSSVGIVFTALIFGVFLPAAKVGVDRLRTSYPIPTFSQRPFGSEESALGRVLRGGVVVAERAPVAFVLLVALLTVGSGVYATGLGTQFSEEQFLPPEETPSYLRDLPEPFRPGEYTVTRDIHFLEDNFRTGEEEVVYVYLEGPMEQDDALEQIQRAGEDPPETFLGRGRTAVSQSVVDAIRGYAEEDPEFARLVRENDADRDGVPDDNLAVVYDELFDSPYRDVATDYLTEDRRSARVVYSVRADASQSAVTRDAREVASRYRFTATATGNIVVFQAVADLILESALVSLAAALSGTAVFLVIVYWFLEGRPSLGLVNLVPIVVTVAALAGTMRAVGLSLNAFTATVLAITIGLGIDYSVHVVHRFADELDELEERRVAGREVEDPPTLALERTVVGTGGALTGSMLTTVFGIGVLVLSIFPAIGQFGLLTGLSVVYSYLASLLVLPSVLAIWSRVAWRGR